MARMNMIQAIQSAMDIMLERDSNTVVFGEDVGYFGGVFRCTAGLQKKYGTSSVIISHDMNVARIATDRIAMLMEGRNHAEGTFDELKAMEDPLVKQFFILM